jgi:hypothetical protein
MCRMLESAYVRIIGHRNHRGFLQCFVSVFDIFISRKIGPSYLVHEPLVLRL